MATSSANLLSQDPFYTDVLPKLLGPDFKPYGTRQEATVGKPDHLHPLSNWANVSSWNALCTLSIASLQVGKYESFSPNMAHTMELRYTLDGRPEYWLFLRQDVFWQPLDPLHFPSGTTLASHFLHPHQVTADDFKFYIDAIMNPHVESAVALRTYFGDIEEVRVMDPFTLVVRWKTKDEEGKEGKERFQMKYQAKMLTTAIRPLARFVYQYFPDGTKIIEDDTSPTTYRTNPIWAQNFAHHWAKNIIVSCGPWLFDGFTDQAIRFRRNPDYYDSYVALVEGIEVKFRQSPDAIWQDFKAGELDSFDIPPNQLAELDRFLQSGPYQQQQAEGRSINRLNYLQRAYSYVGWNEAKPLFKEKKVRQALTLAIDRARIIRQNLNGMGIETTGPFFPPSPSYDLSLKPYPFDPAEARRLLQEEGWSDSDGDGIIEKEINGTRTPFSFTLTYFVKSPVSKAICDYIATALKEIGIACLPNGVDVADLSAVFENRDFDSLSLSWALGTPPEDPKQLWHSSLAKEKGSSNFIGFANSGVDAIIESLEYEFNQQKRNELYHRFDAIIYDEAPYTFLFTPKVSMIYRDYLQNVFIPAERQDLIPGANVGEPISSLFWIKKPSK